MFQNAVTIGWAYFFLCFILTRKSNAMFLCIKKFIFFHLFVYKLTKILPVLRIFLSFRIVWEGNKHQFNNFTLHIVININIKQYYNMYDSKYYSNHIMFTILFQWNKFNFRNVYVYFDVIYYFEHYYTWCHIRLIIISKSLKVIYTTYYFLNLGLIFKL